MLKVEVKMLVAQLCPTLCHPMDCSSPGSSVHGILQARKLERGRPSFLQGIFLMARIHRRTIRKDLHEPDNHDGVITHLEPDILECKVN